MQHVSHELKDARRAAARAKRLAELALDSVRDQHGRELLAHARRAAAQAPMPWEKEIVWLAATLRINGIDETTLTAIGFDIQEVRHAGAARPAHGERAGDYAARLCSYNEPETYAVGEAMLNEPAETNCTVPPDTTTEERDEAIGRLQAGMREWVKHPGGPPPAGGVVDNKPTAAGLHAALHQLEHHVAMGTLSLEKMLRAPGNERRKVVERLSPDDRDAFVTSGLDAMRLTTAIISETLTLSDGPARAGDLDAMTRRNASDIDSLKTIAEIAGSLSTVAKRAHAALIDKAKIKKATERVH